MGARRVAWCASVGAWRARVGAMVAGARGVEERERMSAPWSVECECDVGECECECECACGWVARVPWESVGAWHMRGVRVCGRLTRAR